MASSSKKAKIADAVETVILDALSNGTEVVAGHNKDGSVKLKRIPPTAAMVNVAIRYLAQNGVSRPGMDQEHPISKALREVGMKFKGKKIPRLDAETEDAATA
jgi:hypothetical protein